MIVETRKSAAGTEYWDNEKKKTLFVAAGKKPDFEVTEDPKSMIGEPDEQEKGREPGDGENLEDMTVKQLHDFAKQMEIEIPADVKKKDDIIKYLSDSE